MSRVLESDDERQSEALDSQIPEAQTGHLHFIRSNPMASQWDTAFRRLYRLFKFFNQCSVQALKNQCEFEISCDAQMRLFGFYSTQQNIYQTSQVPSCALIPSTSG